MERISSIDDPRLEAFTQLTDGQLRNRLEPDRGIFIAESDKVIERALDAGYDPIAMLAPEHRVERAQELIDRVEHLDAPVFVAPASELEALAGYEITRGVLCAMRRKPLPDAASILAKAKRVAILEDITNHANVGSAFRNAAAFGFDAVLVTPGCCDPLYRRAVRVSMGSVFKIPWTRIGDDARSWQDEGFRLLRESGFRTAALALHDESIELDDPILKTADRLVLLFGSEGPGLSQRTIAECDHVVKIPMSNGVDSLNVAAASAVAFWELRNRIR